MYDHMFAESTINSMGLRTKAKQEVDFLISILNLSTGAKILDVPCGTGRHSQIFGEEGFKVTGIDISPACIDIAEKNSTNKNVQYQLGNMQELSGFNCQFDCVLNLFSSFGYFSTDLENENVLKGMIDTLKPSGKLVLNLVNRDFLLSIYKPAFWFKSGSVITVNAGYYDPKTHYNESYMTLKNEDTGETTLSYHRIRLYSADEIVGLMEKCGLVDVQVYGDFNGNAFDTLKSTHPFFVGTKV
jgi:SAM-dependent methyltransferase